MIDLLDILSTRKLVAVMRAPDASQFVAVSHVLYEAGFRCLEFTLTTQGAVDALRDARKELPDDVVLGIGTVRTVAQVDAALEAGADFLVSQTFNPTVVDSAQHRGVPFIPGTRVVGKVHATLEPERLRHPGEAAPEARRGWWSTRAARYISQNASASTAA